MVDPQLAEQDEPGSAALRSAPPRTTPGGRGYTDRLTGPLPRFRDVWRLMRQRPPASRLVAEAASIEVRPGGELPPIPAGATAISWVGHATYVLRIGGLTVLTDPVWSRRLPGVPARLTPPGVAWQSLPPVDAVVISHNHYDHLDAPTVRRLPRHTPVLVPAGLGRWFRRRGFTAVTERDWWQSYRIGQVQFDFVPAHHWSRRGLTDTCRSLWGGWVLTAGSPAEPEARVYFAGDTGYGHWFSEIGARYPGIDLALMPVGAYQPRWFMQPMHIDPEEAVRACQEAGATRMATMHWGTFVLSYEPVTEPPQRAAAAWSAAGRPREHLWDLAVGETRIM
jgi:L-ascorbate metabolism protein UlaG (beta-lactamase superfamily)